MRNRYRYLAPVRILLCFCCTLLLASCKKDLLQWSSTPQQLDSKTTDRLNDILVLSDSVVLVAGGERFTSTTLLRSDDGGATWLVQSIPQVDKGMYALAATPDGAVLAAGFGVRGLKSVDSGRTWSEVRYVREVSFTGLAFEPSGRGWLVGGISFRDGYRLSINADGVGPAADSFGYQLNKVAIGADGTVYAAGYGVLQTLHPGSSEWMFGNAVGDNFSGLFAASWGDAYACGTSGSIMRSGDGDNTWQRLRDAGGFDQPAYALHDLLFTDAQHGYCVGDEGVVIHTEDGGVHWMEFSRFTSAHLRSIAALPSGDLLVCGDGGALWRLAAR